MSKSKFRKGQLVVITATYSNCGCAQIKKNTIVNIHEVVDNLDLIRFTRYPDTSRDDVIPIRFVRPLKPGKETTTAGKLFAKATRYELATIK